MKKEDAIQYIAIFPIWPTVWLYIDLLLPFSRKLFAAAQHGGHTYPLITKWASFATHGDYVVPFSWIVGLIVTLILVAFTRIDRIKPLFPIVLSVVWAMLLLHVLLVGVGVLILFELAIGPY